MFKTIVIFIMFFIFFIPGVMGIIYAIKELREDNIGAKKARESGNRAETK